MAIPHAQPGEVVDVRPLGAALGAAKTSTIFKAKNVEVVRMVMPAGKAIAEHKAPGAIIVQCLEGKFAFTAMGSEKELSPGQLLHLEPGEPHSVRAIEDSSFLLTILFS